MISFIIDRIFRKIRQPKLKLTRYFNPQGPQIKIFLSEWSSALQKFSNKFRFDDI